MTPPDEAWKLTAGEFAEIEGNFGCARGEGHAVDDDVLEKLRAIVDRPMVAAALARDGWRPRLVGVELSLVQATNGYDAAPGSALWDEGQSSLEHALAEVQALIDGDSSKGAEPWRRKLSVIEAKLREVQRDVEVKSMFYSVGVLDEVLPELRALIDA